MMDTAIGEAESRGEGHDWFQPCAAFEANTNQIKVGNLKKSEEIWPSTSEHHLNSWSEPWLCIQRWPPQRIMMPPMAMRMVLGSTMAFTI